MKSFFPLFGIVLTALVVSVVWCSSIINAASANSLIPQALSTSSRTPTRTPTKAPTKTPTKALTKTPTKAPTKMPTKAYTKTPTTTPTKTSTVTSTPSTPPTPVPTLAGEKSFTWGGTGDDDAFSVKVDKTGNVYTTGTFVGTVNFNPGSGTDAHTSKGGRDAFLSKFDANGNFLWARTWGGSADDRGDSLAFDSAGNIYVTGPYQNTVDFNPAGGAAHTSNAGNMNNIYLSKFDTNGTFLWVKTWGPSDGGAESYSLAVDASDHVYVVGDFSGTTCDFNPWGTHDIHQNHPPLAGSPFGYLFDAYLSKFDSNGNFMWAKTWGGEGYDDGPGVAVDNLGNIYVAGMYASQNINFDPAGGSNGSGHPAHDSGIQVDAFLSKFDQNGNFQWVRTFGGAGTDEVAITVGIDSSNNVYQGGRFGCVNCNFNPSGTADNHSSLGNLDAFIDTFDANGNFRWARTWGGVDADAVNNLTVDGSNMVYAVGTFSSTVNFGIGSATTSNGLTDAYVSQFDANGTLRSVKTWGGSGSDGASWVDHNGLGNIFVAGWFNNTVNFNPGGIADNHTSNGLGDAFLMKSN